MPMFLVPLEEGEIIPLDKAIVFIGRHPDCDVMLPNSRKVSRKHCCIAQINRTLVVRDLGSMNGVRVNEHVTRDERKLRIGDEIWIGDTGFRVEFRENVKSRKESPRSDRPAEAPLRNAGGEQRYVPQDVPVAIPEEGHDLVIEKTDHRLRSPARSSAESDVIQLRDSDIINEETE